MNQFKISCTLAAVLSLTACQSSDIVKEQAKTASVQLADTNSAEYALDYEGVYKGTLPCADCGGIGTTLTLNKDKTFSYDQTYFGKSNQKFSNQGKYSVNGSILTLNLEGQKSLNLFIAESTIHYVDSNLKPYSGELAADYQLKKQ